MFIYKKNVSIVYFNVNNYWNRLCFNRHYSVNMKSYWVKVINKEVLIGSLLPKDSVILWNLNINLSVFIIKYLNFSNLSFIHLLPIFRKFFTMLFDWFFLYDIRLNYFKKSIIFFYLGRIFSSFVCGYFCINLLSYVFAFGYIKFIYFFYNSLIDQNVLRFSLSKFKFSRLGLFLYIRRLLFSFFIYNKFTSFLSFVDFCLFYHFFFTKWLKQFFYNTKSFILIFFYIKFLKFLTVFLFKFSEFSYKFELYSLSSAGLYSFSLWFTNEKFLNFKLYFFLYSNFLFRFLGNLIKTGKRFLAFKICQLFFWKLKQYNLKTFNDFSQYVSFSFVFNKYLLKIKLVKSTKVGRAVMIPKLLARNVYIPYFFSLFIKQSKLRTEHTILSLLFTEFIDLLVGKGNSFKYVLMVYRTAIVDLHISSIFSKSLLSSLLSRISSKRTILRGSRRLSLLYNKYQIF